MPISSAMLRFVDAAELIKARSLSDEVLRELFEDYQLARETLTKLRKAKPRKPAKVAEYKMIVAELEDEIIQRLVGPAAEPNR